ncbi:MAG: TIGR01777 family oxidoreductase [Desulfobacterales bacterium]|nr:TIGR01777 family oxidoreductase [Desulfobacterales bacterium]
MKVFITGGTGFIGVRLSRFLLDQGHRVTVTGRQERPSLFPAGNFRHIQADTTHSGPWQDALADADAVINLAGQSISGRWTDLYKEQVYNSRILTTRHLVDALPDNRQTTLISASASGYYGDCADRILTESSPSGNDFLAKVSMDWEAEALKAQKKAARVVLTRFAVVLDKNGGALKKMLPPFRFFLGGPLGSGMQWFSWIHLQDLMSVMAHILENPGLKGPINCCSPQPVQNRTLAKTLGRALHRPSFLPAPAFMIRLLLGELGASILGSQRMQPEKLSAAGFIFKFPALEDAVRDILKTDTPPAAYVCDVCGDDDCDCHPVEKK